MCCLFLYIKLVDCGYFSYDETQKLGLVYLSGKVDIIATLGVQTHYFEVNSSALCYIMSILLHFQLRATHIFFVK